jgi:hypothetical protein
MRTVVANAVAGRLGAALGGTGEVIEHRVPIHV